MAGVPFTSVRYQAQMMGEPVESVSGDLWPNTLIMMFPDADEFARLIEAARPLVTPGSRGFAAMQHVLGSAPQLP
ncbi:hypothetical protein RSP03_27880 [Cereibacter sphaeroides]|nr:hypothetical protein RSP03_27880 [Cereibacter sphaeroides]